MTRKDHKFFRFSRARNMHSYFVICRASEMDNARSSVKVQGSTYWGMLVNQAITSLVRNYVSIQC